MTYDDLNQLTKVLKNPQFSPTLVSKKKENKKIYYMLIQINKFTVKIQEGNYPIPP